MFLNEELRLIEPNTPTPIGHGNKLFECHPSSGCKSLGNVVHDGFYITVYPQNAGIKCFDNVCTLNVNNPDEDNNSKTDENIIVGTDEESGLTIVFFFNISIVLNRRTLSSRDNDFISPQYYVVDIENSNVANSIFSPGDYDGPDKVAIVKVDGTVIQQVKGK